MFSPAVSYLLFVCFFIVKEKLQQLEDLKEKYHQDCNIKEKEVSKMKILSWVSFGIFKATTSW